MREDPATGNGAAFLGAYLLEHRLFPGTSFSLRIEQGHEVHRPSLVLLRARIAGGSREVRVGGRVIPIVEESGRPGREVLHPARGGDDPFPDPDERALDDRERVRGSAPGVDELRQIVDEQLAAARAVRLRGGRRAHAPGIGIFTPRSRAVARARSYPASACRATPSPGSFVSTRSSRDAPSAVPSATVT